MNLHPSAIRLSARVSVSRTVFASFRPSVPQRSCVACMDPSLRCCGTHTEDSEEHQVHALG